MSERNAVKIRSGTPYWRGEVLYLGSEAQLRAYDVSKVGHPIPCGQCVIVPADVFDALCEKVEARAASPVLVSREPRWQDDPKVQAARVAVTLFALGEDVLRDDLPWRAALTRNVDALCEAVATSPSGASPAAPRDLQDAIAHIENIVPAKEEYSARGFLTGRTKKAALDCLRAALSPSGSAP